MDEQHRQIIGGEIDTIAYYMEGIENNIRFYGDDCNAEAMSSLIQDVLDLKQAVMGGTTFEHTFNRVSTHTKAELLKKACEESGEEMVLVSREVWNNFIKLKRSLSRAVEYYKDIDEVEEENGRRTTQANTGQ